MDTEPIYGLMVRWRTDGYLFFSLQDEITEQVVARSSLVY